MTGYRILSLSSKKIAISRSLFFGKRVKLEFINKKGRVFKVEGRQGETLVDVVMDHEIQSSSTFGICGQGLACSTCHVILEKEYYDKLDPESDEEWDMLENAPNVSETSRLGCCIKVTTDLDGATITIPQPYIDARI